jgi:cytochrome b involved in lipid metabolism
MEYSLEEIAKHTTPSSLWLVVDNKVYDVTSFFEDHPGGKKPLLKYAGKDCTNKFNSVIDHMETENIEFIKTFCIGSVKSNP